MPLMDDENDYQQVQEATRQTEFSQELASGMRVTGSTDRPGQFDLYQEGKHLGSFQSEESFWRAYRAHVFTEGDSIALHGLGVDTGRPLPEPKRETLPWEMHAIN